MCIHRILKISILGKLGQNWNFELPSLRCRKSAAVCPENCNFLFPTFQPAKPVNGSRRCQYCQCNVEHFVTSRQKFTNILQHATTQSTLTAWPIFLQFGWAGCHSYRPSSKRQHQARYNAKWHFRQCDFCTYAPRYLSSKWPLHMRMTATANDRVSTFPVRVLKPTTTPRCQFLLTSHLVYTWQAQRDNMVVRWNWSRVGVSRQASVS